MEHKPADQWKHTTATSLYAHGDPVGIDLFDDEKEGFTSIYQRFADGTLWPARTVNMSKPDHAKSVLESWMKRGNVIDHRHPLELTE